MVVWWAVGDYVRGVDGKEVQGMSEDEVVALMDGEVSSGICLRVPVADHSVLGPMRLGAQWFQELKRKVVGPGWDASEAHSAVADGGAERVQEIWAGNAADHRGGRGPFEIFDQGLEASHAAPAAGMGCFMSCRYIRVCVCHGVSRCVCVCSVLTDQTLEVAQRQSVMLQTAAWCIMTILNIACAHRVQQPDDALVLARGVILKQAKNDLLVSWGIQLSGIKATYAPTKPLEVRRASNP
eukprot:3786812-Rhodomonas_salina.3